MAAQPQGQLIEVELVRLVAGGHENVGLRASALRCAPLIARNAYVAAKAVRLLPSMKGWFWARLSESVAASSIGRRNNRSAADREQLPAARDP